MNTLSIRTLGLIIETAVDSCSGTELKNMLMMTELGDGDPPKFTSKAEMLRPALLRAQRSATQGDNANAHKALLEFVRLLVESLNPFYRDKLPALTEAMSGDGFELQITRNNSKLTCRVLPNEPTVAPLNPEITALEAELKARGYTQALGHYQLAVKHFAEQDHASSNGQLRAALESLIVSLAVDHAGYTDNGKANQGGVAIKSLYTPGGRPPAALGQPLPERDGGAMLQGIWDISHSNGSHPGLSDAQEARIRMQLITGLAQFLLRHFPI
ncbi:MULTISPECIES: hypothetical protein [unclassified Kitasatospora]|uniref:hypothetical protein n=1 Tax=unclassified Kitasatospora TaxID=2633591 RepID=UPI0033E5C829